MKLLSGAPMREYLVEAAPLTGSNAAKQMDDGIVRPVSVHGFRRGIWLN
jgi:hypothetical protein